MKRISAFILVFVFLLSGCGSSVPVNEPSGGAPPSVTEPSDTPAVSEPEVTPAPSVSPPPSPTVSASPTEPPAETADTYVPQVTYSYMLNSDPGKYYLLLDLKNQVMTAYEKDENGEYTKIVRQMLCSTGKTDVDEEMAALYPDDPKYKPKPTSRGIYKTGGHELFGYFPEFHCYARYWTQLVGGNFMHSIMYSRKDLNTLQSSAYRALGRNVSHGCVRMYVEDAQWIYYNIPPGTTINVSDKEKRNSKLTKSLKSKLSFAKYKEYQKTITDPPQPPNMTAVITAEKAQLRNGCGGDNDRIYANMKKGEKVEILLPSDPWCKVKYKKRIGYTLTANLKADGGIVVSGNVAEYTSGNNAKVLSATVRMYREPKVTNEYICKIPKFESLKVLEESGGWTKVAYFNEIGYVQSKYVKTRWGIVYN